MWYQRDFDTFDHNIFITKIEYDGIRGVANDCFKAYLSSRRQLSINRFNSNHALLRHGVCQGTIFGPILFLFYINYLNHVIKYCKVHHFPDDTNLLHFTNYNQKAIQSKFL